MASSLHLGLAAIPVRGIESRKGVQGGSPCVAGTRIPVWVLEDYRRLGKSDAELLEMYPSLRAENLAAAWEFVRLNTNLVDEQIRENEQ